MGRTYEIGSWETGEELTDRLHEYFEKSQLTDWLAIAELGIDMQANGRLGRSPAPMLYAVAGQAWEGALLEFAFRAHLHSWALLNIMRDVRDESLVNFAARFLEIIAHGPGQCDHSECWVCATVTP